MAEKRSVFDHKAVEKRVQEVWSDIQIDQTDLQSATKPYYNLMMFPYPSAEGLHIGNMYAFTGSDIHGRYMRMQGYEVFEPIGLDGFGIHSENYALKIGRHPMDHASITEKNFYNQLHKIGSMYDWTRTVQTYDPDYYRWTQWLFVQMFKHGLAERKKASVNWCPSCNTVLADEQVIPASPEGRDGKCERCGNIVEKRLLEQWFFRITAYAEKLRKHIPALNWSEKVKTAQTNWIGEKQGVSITYQVVDEGGKEIGTVECFTTHPNTNYGATFVAIAPEHPFINTIYTVLKNEKSKRISQYVEKVKKLSEKERGAEGREKTGVFTELYCINQLNGRKMPLYVSDFVLMDFGTGAVVGVPAHDERDYAFARAFTLPSIKVVDFTEEMHGVILNRFVTENIKKGLKKEGVYVEERIEDVAFVALREKADRIITLFKDSWVGNHDAYAQVDGTYKGIITRQGVITDQKSIESFIETENYPFCYTGSGQMINSERLDGLPTDKANSEMIKYLVSKGWAKYQTSYHLRDWLISRQRYWGPPIPMIYCETCARSGKSWFTTKEGQIYQSKQSSAKETLARQIKKDAAGWYPVPEDQLPVVLPRIEDYKPGKDGVAPLAKHEEFYKTTCPCCGGSAVRETDVSDTFLDSSWYFLRYPSIMKHEVRSKKYEKDNTGDSEIHASCFMIHDSTKAHSEQVEAENLPWDSKITRRWLPVHMYTGGAEHSVLHLLYSRFVTMALHDWGYIDFDEPFSEFFAHGLVIKDGAKMSKSKGNVVNPDEYIASYGADALRLYLMFMGPFSQGGDFRDTAMEGMSRWVNRVYRLVVSSIKYQVSSETPKGNNAEIEHALSKLVLKVTDDTAKRRYNTAIAAMMECTNFVNDHGGVLDKNQLSIVIRMLAPYAPFLAEELWQIVNGRQNRVFTKKESVHLSSWPEVETVVVEEEVTVVVQVNGKMRDRIVVSAQEAKNRQYIESKARASGAKKYLEPSPVIKVIFVPGKLINFVV